ncbi:MAG TPA: CsbD family protein [Verrucomicrobiae bacterium]|nr:CsbD family protein [Verrucomicrobiae bacterium]
MKQQNIKDRAKGSIKEAKGKVKEAAGRAMKNPELEGKGRGEKWAGKARRKVGEAEKVFES